MQLLCFLNILYVTELPEVFLALGTKLSLMLSFFIFKERFYGFEKALNFDEQLDKLDDLKKNYSEVEKLYKEGKFGDCHYNMDFELTQTFWNYISAEELGVRN